MKTFLMVTPQQPKGMLHSQHYESQGNSLLDFPGETHFPIIPLINGYSEVGEAIRVITVTYGEPSNCANNLEILRGELEDLEGAKDISISLDSVDVPFDDSVNALIHTYQLLIDYMSDDDMLYADITFGSKPTPLMLVMSMQYAYRLKENVSMECIVYGQKDWSGGAGVNRIYDVTALAKLDELVRVLADLRVAEPEAALRIIFGLDKEA